MKHDLLIIGGGLSGLFAACVASRQGKKVKILSYGESTLTIGSGIIDVLGYDDDGNFVANPIEGIKNVAKHHPYAKVENDVAKKALQTFMEIAKAENYPYMGDVNRNRWIPTALGNFKPTCLTPYSMNSDLLFEKKHILVVGFEGMKDFYADMVAKNLKKDFEEKKSITSLVIKSDLVNSRDLRDISSIDIAFWLEHEEGFNSFKNQLKPYVTPDTVIVLPAVLGLDPNYDLLDRLQQDLKTTFIEVFSLPPAITGLRLNKMLVSYAKKCGVEIIKKAKVIAAEVVDNKCKSVIVESHGRQKKFYADDFILATGGIYGGGLIAGIGSLKEPIFNIDIEVPEVQTDWSDKKLFSKGKQLFAQFGIEVNNNLVPITKDGKQIIDNLKIVGRNLAGYDFCYEKSGNGVALITAYKAAMDLCKVVR